jgi:hypothetical protein
MPQSVRIGRDISLGFERRELPGPARERRHALVGGKIEHHVAGRGIARPGVEGDVGVERAITSRIRVDDLGADRNLVEVRGVIVQKSPARPLYSEHSLVIWKSPLRGMGNLLPARPR